jgi:ABC-type multidrug transport system permease subunit
MRILLNTVLAAAILAFYVSIIYAFFAYLWPAFPPWLAMLTFIALAAFIIGSPILWLFRIAERVRREREAKQQNPPAGHNRD